jgi:hypothetical protein
MRLTEAGVGGQGPNAAQAFMESVTDQQERKHLTVRVLEQPKHGKIEIENETGFTNFPARNPRAECNKRRSDGVAVIYEPEPGYTGTDSISLDAILPSGVLSKRHYTIDVR